MKTEYAQYVQKVEDAKKYESVIGKLGAFVENGTIEEHDIGQLVENGTIEEHDIKLLQELLHNYKCELNYMQKQLYANMYGFDEGW